jgi:hypothetical protein
MVALLAKTFTALFVLETFRLGETSALLDVLEVFKAPFVLISATKVAPGLRLRHRLSARQLIATLMWPPRRWPPTWLRETALLHVVEIRLLEAMSALQPATVDLPVFRGLTLVRFTAFGMPFDQSCATRKIVNPKYHPDQKSAFHSATREEWQA